MLKQNLALKTDFSMGDVWAIFDVQHLGTVSRLQFEEVYNLLGLYPQRDELQLTFKRYDTDRDDVLKFEDFLKIFGPRDKRYLDVVSTRHSFNEGRSYCRAQCFLPETMSTFKRLL